MSPEIVSALGTLLFSTNEGYPIRPAAHHRLWLDILCNNKINRLLLLAPPESAKTTWILAYIATYIGFHPYNSVILCSVSDSVAVKRSIALRNIVTSPEYKSLFPYVRIDDDMKQEQNEWSLRHEIRHFSSRVHPTMSVHGTGSSVIGSRADVLIGDDLLSFDNTRTKYSRDVVDNWLHSTFFSRIKTGGKIVLIGTSWNSDDSYQRLIRNDSGFMVCRMPLLSEHEDGFYVDIHYPSGKRYQTWKHWGKKASDV